VLADSARTGGLAERRMGVSADRRIKATDVKPSAFVVDAGMPNREGWKFLEKVRKLGHARRASVLILSAGPLSEADENKALELLVQGFLPAPPVKEQVVAELKRVLDGPR